MSQLIDMIMYRANRMHYTPNDLSVFMRIKTTTLYKRKREREPESFRLAELQQLAKKLDLQITIDRDGSVSAKGEL